MTDNIQFVERLNNDIDVLLQFVDYAELKVTKLVAKSAQPATQHFAINAALLALEEVQSTATYTGLLTLLVMQLDAYLALPAGTLADAFNAEISDTVKQLNALIAEVAAAKL